jgi:hypothetical protein
MASFSCGRSSRPSSRRLALGHEDRVVAEAAVAARRPRARRPLASCRGRPASRAVGQHEGRRAAEGAPRRSSGTSASWASSSSRLARRRRAARPAGDRTPGIPLRASTHSPESSATAGSPCGRATARALSSALPAKVSSVSGTSGRSSNASTARRARRRGRLREDAAQLGDLVRVARREHDPRSRPVRRTTRAPPSAGGSARRSRRRQVEQASSSARSNGSPSAVPCTSTKRPSPVMTTFMSVSAATSSS